MTRLSQFTLRNFLILIHDALVTAFALVASFYLRFEGSLLTDRLPLLIHVLPWFVLFSVVVSYLCNLTTAKWRFTSLPDAVNILRVAGVLTLALVVLDYVFIFTETSSRGAVFLGRVTIILFFFLEVFGLSALRLGYRYFRYSRTRLHARSDNAAPALLIGRTADAEVVLRGIENGAIKGLWPIGVLSPSASDLGQKIRNIPVVGGVDDIEPVIRDFGVRQRPIKRVVMTPSAFEPEAHPESVLMRAKRLGVIVSRLPSLEGGDTPRLTNVAVEDLLLRPS
ncbi:nucleoside-diphosphate sugar epimerase/dehydratase, partial [Bradyrhizobium macuxiense]|uniref:nucleoside-diphosphate sugar epimerase/dehydratase n=1 Tax=Bradyrhizobium macuxiense TaxID=1755647 RepID=UPI003D315387